MSLDHRIIGIQISDKKDIILVLEPREEKNQHHGNIRLFIDNPPSDYKQLEVLIGIEIWGGCNDIMIGQKKFADRIGYCSIRLLEKEDANY